jgi:hypothetical protein
MGYFSDWAGKMAKKRGPQNEGISRHIDENKGQVFHSLPSKPSSSTKISCLSVESRDVDEKTRG